MKNLNEEYKNQINSDFAAIMPDLWSKIEAGVDAYEASKKNDNMADNRSTVTDNNIDSKNTNNNVTSFDAERVVVRRKKKNNIMAFSGIAIAAVAALVMVPTLFLTKDDNLTSPTTMTNEAVGDFTGDSATAPAATADETNSFSINDEADLSYRDTDKSLSWATGAEAGIQEDADGAEETMCEDVEDFADEEIMVAGIVEDLKKDSGVLYFTVVDGNHKYKVSTDDEEQIELIESIMKKELTAEFKLYEVPADKSEYKLSEVIVEE